MKKKIQTKINSIYRVERNLKFKYTILLMTHRKYLQKKWIE